MSEAVTKAPASPKASRLALPRWLDPKLLLGLLLVIVAMLLGARVFASADDTVAVYQVKAAMFTGDPLTADSVSVTRVHFAEGLVADNYVNAAQPLPTGQVVNHDLRAGEMLTQGSVAPKVQTPTVELSVPISTGDISLVTKIADRCHRRAELHHRHRQGGPDEGAVEHPGHQRARRLGRRLLLGQHRRVVHHRPGQPRHPDRVRLGQTGRQPARQHGVHRQTRRQEPVTGTGAADRRREVSST